jgi:predicted GNAT family N-acyltransferase
MTTQSHFELIEADWIIHRDQLAYVRKKVFIEEQKVPEELEWDEFDNSSHHILAVNSIREPVGTGRLKPDGQIGRMAVIKDMRKSGIGSAILIRLIEIARQNGLSEVYLHAQISAVEFYHKFGFLDPGEIFFEADIPHRAMKKILE